MQRLDIDSFGSAPVHDLLSYPGRVPEGSFLYDDGDLWQPDASEPAGLLSEELARRSGVPATRRWAVVCAGPNANPAQMRRKLGSLPGRQVMLFERRELAGVESVYAGHVARHGVVPATLERTQGSRWFFVVYFTDEQLRAVHGTEHGNYTLSRLHGVEKRTGDGRTVTALHGFLSVKGVLLLGGAPVPLASCDQRALLEALLRETAKAARLPTLAGYLQSPDRHRQALDDAVGELNLRRPARLHHRPLGARALLPQPR